MRQGSSPTENFSEPFAPAEVQEPISPVHPVYEEAAYQLPEPQRLILPRAQEYYDPVPVQSAKHPRVKHRRRWPAYTALGLIVAAVLGLLLIPSATITVIAKTQPINRELQITIDKTALAADSKNLIIPGLVVDKDQQQTQQFNTTGQQNVGIKATGAVVIYNYTGKTLKFKAATTTFTVGAKLYHLQQDISGIKPTRNFANSNNVNPGTLTAAVPIVADQAGEDSNLPANTRFEMHNQVLGNIPQLLYAINPDPVTGGLNRFQAVVSQQDIDQATQNLKDTLFNAAKQQFLNAQNLVLLPSGSDLQNQQISFDKKVNDASVSFNGTVTGHLKALLFNDTTLRNLVKQRIQLTLDAGQKLNPDQEQWDMSFKSLDLDKGLGILTVKYTGLIVYQIDTDAVIAKARGKTPVDFKQMMLSEAQIDDLSVKLSPFWAKTIPTLAGRVKVIIQAQ